MIVRTPKLWDSDLLDVLARLFDLFPMGSASASIGEGVVKRFANVADLHAYPYDRSARLIQSFSFQCQPQESDTVLFHRGITSADQISGSGPQTAFSTPGPSAYFDELAFFQPRSRSGNYRPLTDEQRIAVTELINAHVAPTDAATDDEARQLSKVVSKQIDDLRKLNLKMTEGLAEARHRDQEAFRTQQVEFDQRFQERLSQLSEKEAELERRREELNDREPQHERRRLREMLTASLRGSLREPLVQSRRSESIAYLLYLAVGGAFISISLALAVAEPLADGTAAFWMRAAKSIASGVAGAAFAWAGLAGLKASAVALREHEKAVERYAFDMDRASWIVETILQINLVEQSRVPDQWLEAVCRDLFASSSERNDERPSLEAFAALFDATAKARIGTNGIDFEIDRKGARKLAQEN